MNNNKWALVTGASGGVGKEIATILAEKRWNLVLVARSQDKLAELKKDLNEKIGIDVKVFPCDLSKSDAAHDIFNFCESEHIKIDLLINNAGAGLYGPSIELGDKALDMLRLNILALTQMCTVFGKDMAERKSGSILNIGSIAGNQPTPLFASYAASKSYVLNYSLALRHELSAYGVNVTCVQPGYIRTQFDNNCGIVSEKYKRPVYYLWGGEPFLYPDLCDLVDYIQKSGSFCSVNTNGTLLEKYAERVVRDKWNVIFVSLDAFREVNDEIRGPGSYDRVVKGFEAINREKKKQNSRFPSMGIVTTVTNKNYKDLQALAIACKDFNIDWHIYNLGTYTNDEIVSKHKEFFREKLGIESVCLEAYNTGYNNGIDGAELHKTLETIHSTDYGYLSITVPTLNPEKTDEYYHHLDIPVRDHCIVPWTQASINYNGDVCFCADYTEYPLGNIKEKPFKEIYNGERANKFRHAIDECPGSIFPGCIRCYQNMLFGKKLKGY